VLVDVSEQKRAEAALRKADRRKDEFLATLAHELRNPLAPIRNALHVLRADAAAEDDRRRARDMIERQVQQMVRLIDDLLDVSRITSGKIRLERHPLDLVALLQAAIDGSQVMLQRYGHTLELVLPDRPVQVLGDATRLTQVVVNLLTNAAKYTPNGGRVSVRLRDDGRLASLQVADNGMGMPDTLLQRAFEPFVQGERALDRAEGGLGIGLTLVRSITELHGGAVAAASAGPGQGTTVTVTLPLAEPAPAPAPAPAPPEASSLVPRRVLVVDDGHDAAETLAMLLRMHGHEVRVAYDGPQALRYAEATPPQVVLLDIGLPGMSGYEVAQRLRALPGLEGLRLIALTGYGQQQDQQAAAGAGFDHHLIKPVDPDELLALLAA
jgi:CheY-like chemotaxis protein